MESNLGKLEDGRKKNGCKPGENRGGGWKTPMEKVRAQAKAELVDIAKAEFWVALAQDKAVPRLTKMLDNPDDAVAFKAVKEIIDRTLGKPKESVEIFGKEGAAPIRLSVEEKANVLKLFPNAQDNSGTNPVA